MPAARASVDDLLAALARHGGLATARALGAALGVSQPSVSRLVAQANSGVETVLAVGRARAARYAPVRAVRGFGHVFPLHRVAADGRLIHLGNLFTLAAGCTLLRGADGIDTLFDGLPWFCDDMRPQGFLGRLFARAAAPLGVPDDPRAWSDDDVLAALSQRGEDCVGDLILGAAAAERYLQRALAPPPPVCRDDYPALALALLAGGAPGSSAGGEQPKFACTVAAADGTPRPLLVKFSPPVAAGATARRWADLLVAEHLALATLAAAGVAAARTELVEVGGRVMLEVERFDRSAHGRIGLFSGSAIEAQFVGGAATWSKLAAALAAQRRLSAADARRLATLELFGAMIGNSDMHLGNVSFYRGEPFALAPCYDMLPMRYSPAGRGEVLEATEPPAIPPASHANRDAWRAAADWAQAFWRRVAADARLGGRLDAIAADALAALAAARRRCDLLG